MRIRSFLVRIPYSSFTLRNEDGLMVRSQGVQRAIVTRYHSLIFIYYFGVREKRGKLLSICKGNVNDKITAYFHPLFERKRRNKHN